MSACPTCGKAVDPLRAPAVSVMAGKIVGFCSRDCATAAESRPVAAPRRDATPIPPTKRKDATPVPK
jgi:YHS domain-containing protein